MRNVQVRIDSRIWRLKPLVHTLVSLSISVFYFYINLFVFILEYIHNKKRYEQIVIMLEGGFGHTIINPLWISGISSESTLLIIITEKGRQNQEISKIWKRIKVVNLPRHIGKSTKHCRNIMFHISLKTIRCAFKWSNSKYFELSPGPYNCNQDSNLLSNWYHQANRDDEFVRLNVPAYTPQIDNIYSAHIAAYFLVQKKKIDTSLLFNSINKIFRRELSRIPANQKYFLVYLRSKDHDIRCGSRPKEMNKVFEYLINLGFSILLVGDYSKDDFKLSNNTNIFDHTSVGIPSNAFYVCATYLCSFFVGDCGGGAFLPAYLSKPSLMINAVNVGRTPIYKSLVMPKHVYSSLSPRSLLADADYLYHCHTTDYKNILRSNTSSEIIAAIQKLLGKPVDLPFQLIDHNNIAIPPMLKVSCSDLIYF